MGRMLRWLALLSLLAQISSATAAAPLDADQQKAADEARNVYVGCLHMQAQQLDDSVSDAATIAAATAAACTEEYRDYARAIEANDPALATAVMEHPQGTNTALLAVLQERRLAKEKSLPGKVAGRVH